MQSRAEGPSGAGRHVRCMSRGRRTDVRSRTERGNFFPDNDHPWRGSIAHPPETHPSPASGFSRDRRKRVGSEEMRRDEHERGRLIQCKPAWRSCGNSRQSDSASSRAWTNDAWQAETSPREAPLFLSLFGSPYLWRRPVSWSLEGTWTRTKLTTRSRNQASEGRLRPRACLATRRRARPAQHSTAQPSVA